MFSVSRPYNITGRWMSMNVDNIGEMIIMHWEGRITPYNYLCACMQTHLWTGFFVGDIKANAPETKIRKEIGTYNKWNQEPNPLLRMFVLSERSLHWLPRFTKKKVLPIVDLIFESLHPSHVKRRVVQNLCNRAITVHQKWHDAFTEIDNLRFNFQLNGSSSHFLTL